MHSKSPFVRNSILALVLQAVIGASLCSADTFWPGWLGPERNGWVANFEVPQAWPEQLQESWHVEVGTGYGTPLVDGNKVFLHTRVDEEETVWCFQLDSGEVIWKEAFAVPFKMGGGGEWHGKGPKSNPLLFDGRLFTMSIAGDMSAWNADTGELLWRTNYATRFDTSHPYWGACTSPVADGNRVMVRFGNDEKGVLVALDVSTGEEIWSLGNDGAAYSSPLVTEFEGRKQLVEWNHNNLAGVDIETGKQLWQFPLPHVGTQQNMPTPSILNGRILVGGENRGIRSIEPHLSRIGNKDVWSANELWHQKEVALDMSSAVVNGKLLFGFSHYDSGRIFCLDSKDGTVLWVGPPRTGQNVTFLAVPGYVLALIDDGELRIIEATRDEYKLAKTYSVAESPCWAAPVLMNRGVLVKTRESLKLLDFAQ